jgi:hypothetical protein
LEDLEQNGTYYFEVDSNDFADEETANINIHNSCGEMNIFTDGKDTHINVFYNSRQQYATYKKIDALPKNIRAYLERNGIKPPK